ncbi:MAG: gliding motility-associated C-terminal domain-containing protein [Sphingobacteriaceae bacterium]|nr:gliding motility-associated C-terminal domain-containing protein [Sphingobacteriaceae bacterium]
MLKRLRFSVLFVVFFLGAGAQIDTSFWFVAPDISATLGQSPVQLHIQTYNQAATVYVRQPANITGVNATLTIPANTIQVLDVTASITAVESAPVNSVSTKGMYISSNANISAYYTIGAGANKEMLSLKGSVAKGVDFYIPVPNTLTTALSPTDGGVGFDIVATGTGVTVLLITPRTNCVSRAANVTFAVSLNQGETFSVRDNNSINPSELDGSIVSSDKPIAVTVSGMVINTNTTCVSYYADQITSSNNLGKNYVLLRGDGNIDMGYILSTVNATSLQITTGTTVVNTLINYGETFTVDVNSGMSYINSDKPIYVIHTSAYGCKFSGAQIAPAFCAGSYTNNFTRLSADSLNLNLITRSGFQNTFTLTSNGVNIPISPASFTVVPGSSGVLVAAKLYYPVGTIAVGSHNVLRNNRDLFGLSIINGSTGGGSAYANTSEFKSNTFVVANALPSATICSNTTFTLNGSIGGGPITGIWTHNGLGTLSGPITQYTNNVYTPNPLDTVIKPLTFNLTSTGICPNISNSFSLWVTQAPIVNAGIDQTICSNNATVQLGGNVIGPTNQGVWQVVAPGSGTFVPNINVMNPLYNCSNSDTTLNNLKFVLTSTNNAGCLPENDTVVVYMNHAPLVFSSLTKPIIKCSNSPNVFLNGTIAGTVTSTGQWTTTGTGFFNPNNLSLITSYVPTPADIATGTVQLKLTTTNNQQCLPVADSVVVLFSAPPVVNVGIDLNSCKNNPVFTLSANITGTITNTGEWYGGSGTYSPSNTDLNPTYTASPAEISAGFVVLSFSTTNNGLCLGVSDQLRIDFRDDPIPNFSANIVCLNDLTTFTDLSINTEPFATINSWIWKYGDGASTNSLNPSYTYTAPGVYTVQLIVGNSYGCLDSITKPVTIYALPDASMSITRNCAGSEQEITFTDLSTILPPATIPDPGGYYWDFGGFGFSNAKDTSIVFPSQGIYNITHIVTSGNGCKTTITRSLNITPKPLAQFFYDINLLPSLQTDVTFIDSSRAAVTWNWDFGNGSTSTLQNPNTFYTANGDYTVTLTVTDQFGCPSVKQKIIRISNIVEDVAELIPNLITPNGDGKNDDWRLDFVNLFYKQAEIDIYNRWGEHIFHSVGYDNAWNGSYLGNPLQVGVYFYVIKLNDSENRIYKGTINLLK